MTENRSGPPSGIGGTADDRAETNSSALLHEKPPRQFTQRLPRSDRHLPGVGDNSLADLAARIKAQHRGRTLADVSKELETLQQRIEQDRAAGTLAEPDTKREGAA